MKRKLILCMITGGLICLFISGITYAKVITSGVWSSNNHIYIVVLIPGIGWDEATLDMNGILPGAHLATITSKEEHDFIESLFTGAHIYGEYWLGGFQVPPDQANANAGWTWVTGEEWGYENWIPNEPNDYYGAGSEQYLTIWGSYGWKWNDEGYNDMITGYVAEATTPTEQINIIKLNTGWNLMSFSVNKCFYEGTPPTDQPDYVEKVDISTLGVSSLADWFNLVMSPTNAWQMVIGANGAMDSSLPTIFHTLKYISPCSGYWVKVKGGIYNAILSLDGSLFATNCAMPLQEGWNLVGCPLRVGYYDTDSPPVGKHVLEGTAWVRVAPPVAAYVFRSIEGLYSMIISEDGTYDPDLPLAFSSLNYVAPGYGYWVKMKQAANLMIR